MFGYEGTLPKDSVDNGLKAICPRAGDVLIMPEALTHGVLPWLPTDRARYAMLLTVTPSDRGQPSHPANNTSLPPEIYAILSPETQELAQFCSGVKSIAKGLTPPTLSMPAAAAAGAKL